MLQDQKRLQTKAAAFPCQAGGRAVEVMGGFQVSVDLGEFDEGHPGHELLRAGSWRH
ncbi:hypothetical protein D3C73_1601130 [compost metagenome]